MRGGKWCSEERRSWKTAYRRSDKWFKRRKLFIGFVSSILGFGIRLGRFGV
jgi:hypothetical protein